MVEIIEIKKTYGITDLGREENVDKLVASIKLPDSNQIAIDLSGCIADYPTSSRLFDIVLFYLEKYSSNKKLIIITDLNFPDETLFNLFFLYSRYLNLSDKFRLNDSEWKFILDELKIKKDIDIQINKQIMPVHNKKRW